MPSDILYGIGFAFSHKSFNNRYLAIAAGYDYRFAIGWGEDLSNIVWKHISLY